MKQNNSALKHKLRNYSILAGSLLAAAGTADGQIIYQRLSPHVMLNTNGATYKLDLNGDSISDAWFSELIENSLMQARIKLQNEDEAFEGKVVTTDVSGTYKLGLPYVVNPNDNIGASGKWVNYSSLKKNQEEYAILGSHYSSTSFWYWGKGDTAKFVALRIKSDSVYYYGWVRITVTPGGSSITINDYAYQSIPDSSIIAGDNDGAYTGIAANHLKNVSVYASGKNVIVKYPDARDRMTIIVRDITGQEIQAIQTTDELYELNLANAAAGVYLVTVRSKDAEITKKVSIQ